MWYKDIEQPYEFQSKYTEKTYEHLIEEIFDKDEVIKGYRNNQGNPEKTGKKNIASEVYSYFATHYYKVIDTLIEIEKDNRAILHTDINLIDLGANIGTATFAYLDLLHRKLNSKNIRVRLILIEPDATRVNFLQNTIDKYKELSGFDIDYEIIQDKFEDCQNSIIEKLEIKPTVILISNILNWIKDIDDFKLKLISNVYDVNANLETYIVNIESQYSSASERLINLYGSLNYSKLDIKNNKKKIPKFRNPTLNFFRGKFGNDIYNPKGYYYHYGHIINHPITISTTDIDTIKKAYYKSIYTIENYYIYDEIELKYIKNNLCRVSEYIKKLIDCDKTVDYFEHEYYIRKSLDKDRSMYLDDILNDIIHTAVLITKGVILDKIQSNDISFGNRIDDDIDSPFVFKPYYNQYFNEYQKKEDEYKAQYSNYYKIDLKSFYNNIDHNLIKKWIEQHCFECNWYKEIFNNYIINKKLLACKEGKGIAQGPDFSNLIANIYLKNFDDWYTNTFKDSNMVRYVDDIIIFSNSEQRCLEIKDKCYDYLFNKLLIEINPDKNECGQTSISNENIDNDYFKTVSEISSKILKNLYRLDRKNYDYYKSNNKDFLKIYQSCLNRIGIAIPIEWLSIKLEKEEAFLEKIKKIIPNIKNRLQWLSKQIYKYNIDLGQIPKSVDCKSIDIWEAAFRKNKKNKIILSEIEEVREKLENKMNEIIYNVKLDIDKQKQYKSVFKFTFKKLATFKTKKYDLWINDIFDYFPYCNKKMFWAYNELECFIIDRLNNETEVGRYDMYIYIWLLGEYKSKEHIQIIEEKFLSSYSNDQIFLNNITSEVILKIGICSKEFIKILEDKIKSTKDYYRMRNMLLILHANKKSNDFKKIINDIKKDEYDDRIKLFIEWISNNADMKLIEEVVILPEDIIEKYRNHYPLEKTYSGYKSL